MSSREVARASTSVARAASWSLVLTAALLAACGGADAGENGDRAERAAARGGERGGRGQGPPGGFPGGLPGAGADSSAIPVRTALARRGAIADYIETNGVLEAEQEVDVVARTAGPLVRLFVDEGDVVRQGQSIAQIDADELRNQLDIARVDLEERRLAFERAKVSLAAEVISQEVFDQARAAYESAKAQLESREIQLSYTEIRAPFGGRIVARYVRQAQYVTTGSPLVRLSDFAPLLCPIQIPEKDLNRIRIGQQAYLTVEAFPERRFQAAVHRIVPAIDPATGTFKVTLSVDGQGALRPGMFATVFLEIDRREDALIVPRQALVLESVGDAVYVVDDGVASRRELELGFREGELVEVVVGLSEGDEVLVVGQDAVTEGTRVTVVGAEPRAPTERGASSGQSSDGSPPEREGAGPGGDGRGFPEIDWSDPAQVQRVRGFMKQRGLTDEQIEERLERLRSRAGGEGGRDGGGDDDGPR